MRFDPSYPPKKIKQKVRFTEPCTKGYRTAIYEIYDGSDEDKLLQVGQCLVLMGINYTSKELV